MKEMPEMERLAGEYHEALDLLGSSLHTLDNHLKRVRDKYLPEIRRAARAMVTRHARLKVAIEARPDLFKRPKTVVLSGVKCGFAKGKGKTVLKYSEAKTIELIEKLFPGEAYEGLELIEAKYSVRKSALARMEAVDLKRLGVTIEDAGDEVVIKVMDSEDEKLVKAFLKEAGIKEEA